MDLIYRSQVLRALPSRTRNRYRSELGNTSYSAHGSVWLSINQPFTVEQAVCDDIIGNYPNGNAFSVERSTWDGCVLNGQATHGVDLTTYTNWPGGLQGLHAGTLPAYVSPSYARLLAQSGPLTPKVNLPLMAFELKDLPRMLKHAGDLLHKIVKKGDPSGLDPFQEAASSTLAFQFGWKPLIEDIGKLLKFSEFVEKRQRVLAGAQNKPHGQRTKIGLGSETDTYTDSDYPIQSGEFSFRGKYQKISTRKSWATTRWVIRDGQQFGKDPGFQAAMQTALGTNLSQIPITVWKGMPWSWMIDWFGDISNVLQATLNTVYYIPLGSFVMVTDEVKATTEGHNFPGGGNISPGTYTWSKKTRAPRNPGTEPALPFMQLPFMDSFKLSILGSLAIQKIGRLK